MTSRAKHAMRSHRGYSDRQQAARRFLSYCSASNAVKKTQQARKVAGFLSRILRRRTTNHE